MELKGVVHRGVECMYNERIDLKPCNTTRSVIGCPPRPSGRDECNRVQTGAMARRCHVVDFAECMTDSGTGDRICSAIFTLCSEGQISRGAPCRVDGEL